MSDFLPHEWLLTELGNYIYLKNGFAFKSSDYLEPNQTTIPIIRISDIQDNLVKTDSATHVLPNTLAEEFIVLKGDLLIAMSGATTGKVGSFNESKLAYQNQRVGNLKLISEELGNKSFRNYLIQNLSKKILESAYGGAQPNISGKTIEEILIPLPPKAEQEKIAELLDSHLAQVETIKTRLNAIFPILKKFRQSVLADAVSGRLIENKNYELADDGYPKVWQRLGLSEIGKIERGKSKHRPRNDPKLFGTEYPFIQTGEVANSNGYIYSATKFYSEFGLQQSKLFDVDTLCITIAANIADTAILKMQACFPDSIVGFTPNKEKCEVEFIKILIDVNKANLEHFAPATAQKNINLKVLESLKLPIPTIEEQKEIVERVEQIFTYANTIETQVNNALQRVNQLTQSILHQAFTGQLTADWRANHPELITGDNSAEKLLEQIQKQKATPTKKIKKVKNAT